MGDVNLYNAEAFGYNFDCKVTATLGNLSIVDIGVAKYWVQSYEN